MPAIIEAPKTKHNQLNVQEESRQCRSECSWTWAARQSRPGGPGNVTRGKAEEEDCLLEEQLKESDVITTQGAPRLVKIRHHHFA